MKKFMVFLLSLLMASSAIMVSFAADFDFLHKSGDKKRQYSFELALDDMAALEDLVFNESEFVVEFEGKYYNLTDISEYIRKNPKHSIYEAVRSGIQAQANPNQSQEFLEVLSID